MKKKLSFRREILENIDYFNYLDPDSLCKSCKDEKDEEEMKDDEDTPDEEFGRIKRYSKPVDVRRYLQYVNAKSD